MLRSSLIRAAALVAIALSVAACGARSEPTGELAPAYPVTAPGAGETPTTLSAQPQRIVALDPGSAELVAALGARDQLVGAPPASVSVKEERPAVVLKDTGQIDVDEIVRLKPDLVVATPDTDPVDLAQIERRTRAPVYLQPSRTIEAVEQAAIELGFLLGHPAEGRRLAGSLQEQAAEVMQRLEGVARPRSSSTRASSSPSPTARSWATSSARRRVGTSQGLRGPRPVPGFAAEAGEPGRLPRDLRQRGDPPALQRDPATRA